MTRTFAFFIEQHDGEHLIVNEAAEELADALEQGIEIEEWEASSDRDLVKDF